MTYKTVSNNEGTHVMLDGVEIAIKPDKVSALDFVAGHAEQRAEAAEARAAMLQEALGPNARILNKRRDDQIKQLTTERDELRDKLNDAMKISRGFVAERDELRRQLSEAQHAIDVLSNTVVTQDATIKRLEQAHEDVAEYRAEIERLNQAAKMPKHIQEALNEGNGVYRL